MVHKNSGSNKRYKQGFYKPINPQKYRGDINNIVYRSSWEQKFCYYCDTTPSVLEWSSETTVVAYPKPTDPDPRTGLPRWHRYFLDFKIKIKTINGIETHLVEIKPYAQTQKPKGNQVYRGKLPKVWETYLVNMAKWEAAQKYASQYKYKFTILNEYDLGIKSR